MKKDLESAKKKITSDVAGLRMLSGGTRSLGLLGGKRGDFLSQCWDFMWLPTCGGGVRLSCAVVPWPSRVRFSCAVVPWPSLLLKAGLKYLLGDHRPKICCICSQDNCGIVCLNTNNRYICQMHCK